MGKLYVAQVGLGLTHLSFLCDDTLTSVLDLIGAANGSPREDQYQEIVSLLAGARGDVLHFVQVTERDRETETER